VACECSAIHLAASCSVMKPLTTSVSPSGHRISTRQPVPGFFRAMKVGCCSSIRRICAGADTVQASYPAITPGDSPSTTQGSPAGESGIAGYPRMVPPNLLLTGQRAVIGGEALNATFGPANCPPTNSATSNAAASKLPPITAKKPMLDFWCAISRSRTTTPQGVHRIATG
jgi:hypothetical protein